MCTAHSIPDTSNATDRGEAFADRLVDVLNSGAVALMISIGHRTGLFDAMAGAPPSTAIEIADAAGLDRRYVREWLGAMACARVVELDESGERYGLPAAHAPLLTRAAGADNLAPFAQYISVLGGVESEIVDCFLEGGGVPYERFERFHEVMAEDSGQSVLSSLFDHIVPLVPGIDARLASGIDVLDLGCGSGRALVEMARRYPLSRFVGFDLCEEPIAAARARAAELGLDNVELQRRDARAMDEVERFDLITTFDAVHDQAHPDQVLANIRRALRPEGHYLMQDIDASSEVAENLDHPLGAFLYTVSTMHCMTVSLAQGGAGLGTMWGRQTARRMLADAGFGSITEHTLPHDPQNRYYVVTR